MSCLHDLGQVTIGSKLETLSLSPHFYLSKPSFEPQAPGTGTINGIGTYDSVKRPYVDIIEKLRE